MLQLACPQCHLPVSREFYFCPNCGKSLHEPPLSVSVARQIWMYALSILIPWTGFLLIGYWHGIKYLRSPDYKAQKVGVICLILLAVSTIITVWLSIIWIQSALQQTMTDLNGLY